MIFLPTIYPSGISRAICAIDEFPAFKELRDGFLRVIVSLTADIGVWWALLLGLAVIPVLNRAVPALSARMPELTWRRAFSGGRLAQAPIR